jgi:hypothetical protein
MNRRATQANKGTAAESRTGRLPEPSACDRCGAVFARRTWRRTRVVPEGVRWTVCPACAQTREQTGFGRIVVRGAFALAHEDDIRRRIANVGARAGRTQPERRVASIERGDGALEILTTSQKLAHRIVHELKKQFRGRATYAWSDDGTLYATWQRDR